MFSHSKGTGHSCWARLGHGKSVSEEHRCWLVKWELDHLTIDSVPLFSRILEKDGKEGMVYRIQMPPHSDQRARHCVAIQERWRVVPDSHMRTPLAPFHPEVVLSGLGDEMQNDRRVQHQGAHTLT